MWTPRGVPSSVAFVDVETTGLGEHDRVVSLGAIWLSMTSVTEGALPTSFIHLVFNPEKKCHPEAARVHGYSDYLLSCQEPFSAYSSFVREYLACADLIVSHNVQFDLAFINREFRMAGVGPLVQPTFCTMNACHERGLARALDRACQTIGLQRTSREHGALEDSWLTMMLYLWLHGCPYIRSFADAGEHILPFNLRAAKSPKTAAVASSNTGLSAAGSTEEANRISTLVEFIKQAKRDGRLSDAERELLREVDRQEAQAKSGGGGVAPWYYEQLAVIYTKQRRFKDEIDILARYDRQPKAPGVMPEKLRERFVRSVLRHAAPG